jgi:hypothetical protein
MIALFAVFLLGAASSVLLATGASAQDPPTTTTTTTTTVSAPTTPTTTAPGDEPTTGEALIAGVAILGGTLVALAVIWLVSRAHDIQATLAAANAARGGSVSTAAEPAAGFEAARAGADISISGPDEVAVDTAGEFTVAKTVTDPSWSVSGIGSFTQSLKDDDHTLVFTPHEEKTDVTLKVTAGTTSGEKGVKILAAAKSSFVVRFAVKHWGLVVVAVAIVFGAIALGVTGHLDGGNFVALVAPLAALLGVTAAVSERGGGNGSAVGGAPASGNDGGSDGS